MADETPGPAEPEERQAKAKQRAWLRAALIAVGVVIIGAIALSLDFEPDLEHLDIAVTSGSATGHYSDLVERFARRAEHEGGRVRNAHSAGSGENLERLSARECEVDFGLVQDGAAFDDLERVEAIARLPEGETLFFFGRDGDLVTTFRDLEGTRIGVGPEGSGTAQLAEALLALPGFDEFRIERVHGAVSAQIEQAAAGELDFAAAVLQEDAALAHEAVTERGLRIASFETAPAAASRLPGVRAGWIDQGHYDPVAGVPAGDRRVLQVDTLLLASACASRSEINAVLSVLGRELPGFVEHNRNAPPPHGLAMSNVATEFYENHGPPMVDEYLPRVVDVIPLSNFMTFVVGVSFLFNLMSLLNRFRLWRLDTRRVKIEEELRELFGGGITRKEIDLLDPATTLIEASERAALDGLIARLRELVADCRKQAVSMLVPMGQEMVYRYQESLMLETIAVLQRFRRSLTD